MKKLLFLLSLVSLFALNFATPVLAQSTAAVAIQGFAFNPTPLNIPVNTTVTWTNLDTAPHTATSSPAGQAISWDTGNLTTNQRGSFTFTRDGSYTYICTVHPRMQGVVNVGVQTPATGDMVLSNTLLVGLFALGSLTLMTGVAIFGRFRRSGRD